MFICLKGFIMTRRYDSQEVRRRTISAGIKLFIEKGYHKTTVSDICRLADVSNGSFFNVFRTKNGLLMELVVNMFNGQFDAADSLLPADSEPHMLYVFETAIQLAIAETSENLRDIYVEAYTNRETLCYIHDRTAASAGSPRQDCLSCSVRSIPIGVKAAALKPKSVLLR